MPTTSYYIPRNFNNQVETNVKPISSHSTPHTLYHHIIVKPTGTPYPGTLYSLKHVRTPVTVSMHS